MLNGQRGKVIIAGVNVPISLPLSFGPLCLKRILSSKVRTNLLINRVLDEGKMETVMEMGKSTP